MQKSQKVVRLDKLAAGLIDILNRRPQELTDLPEDAFQVLDGLREDFTSIATSKTIEHKKKSLRRLQSSLERDIHFIRPTLNGGFNIVPAQRGLVRIDEKEKSIPPLRRKMRVGP